MSVRSCFDFETSVYLKSCEEMVGRMNENQEWGSVWTETSVMFFKVDPLIFYFLGKMKNNLEMTLIRKTDVQTGLRKTQHCCFTPSVWNNVVSRTCLSPVHISIFYQWLCSPLLDHGRSFSVSWFYTQSVGLVGWRISPLYKHRIKAHKHLWLLCDSNQCYPCLSQRRQFMP